MDIIYWQFKTRVNFGWVAWLNAIYLWSISRKVTWVPECKRYFKNGKNRKPWISLKTVSIENRRIGGKENNRVECQRIV